MPSYGKFKTPLFQYLLFKALVFGRASGVFYPAGCVRKLFILVNLYYLRVVFMGASVSFRDVDEQAFREFKATVARQGMRMGEAVSKAFLLFTKHAESKPAKRMSLLDLKPVSFGPGSENLSKQVDEVLYGWKH